MAREDEQRSAADVCSLPPAALADRLAMIRSDFAPHVKAQEELPGGRAWEFDTALRERLEELVALERRCCSGLDWRILEITEGRVRLEVRGAGAGDLPALLAATPSAGQASVPASAASRRAPPNRKATPTPSR